MAHDLQPRMLARVAPDYSLGELAERIGRKKLRVVKVAPAPPPPGDRYDKAALEGIRKMKTALFSTLWPRMIEFGRTQRELMQIRRSGFKITKTDGEFRVAKRGLSKLTEPASYYTDDLADARGTAAAMIREMRKAKVKAIGLAAVWPRMIEFGAKRRAQRPFYDDEALKKEGILHPNGEVADKAKFAASISFCRRLTYSSNLLSDLRAVTGFARGDQVLKMVKRNPHLSRVVRDESQVIARWKGAAADVLQKRFYSNTIGDQAVSINRAKIADKMKQARRYERITKPAGISPALHEIMEKVAVPFPRHSTVSSRASKAREAAGLPSAASREAFRKKVKAIGLAALCPRMIEFGERERNSEGEFVANDTGGADPTSMHAAYGPGTVAAIAGTTGVLGAGLGLAGKRLKRALSSGGKAVARKVSSVQFAALTPRQAKLAVGGLAVAGAGAIAGAGVHTFRKLKKQKEWAANAGPNDMLKIADDLYIDKHGAMYPGDHSRVKSSKVSTC